ncbi:unnamed protein product [Rhizophagus irregularis]|nr:unnamed protein product [Rhizophagus irregularis]
MDASNNISQTIWNKGTYMATCIRKWGTHFIQTGELLIYRQEKHSKLESLLNDKDFKNECQIWLKQQMPESRSPTNLKTYIEETVFPKLTGHIKKETISEKTCRNYMHLWGYKYDEKKKGVYYDGHERPDVDENILRSKHIGRSIMVSTFLCPCHGLLQLSDEQLQANPHIEQKEAFILRSVQTDGYWKSEHMLDQV